MKTSRCYVALWAMALCGGAFAQSAAPATQPATAPATAPTTGPAAQFRLRIVRLIDDLEADDFQKREKATAALIDLGPDVLDLLSERLPDGTAELRQRATVIAQAIAKRWQGIRLDAGKVVAGFQAFLMPPGPVKQGGRITLSVVVTNVGPKPQAIVDFRGFDVELAGAGVLAKVDRADGRIIVRKAGEAAMPKEAKAIDYGDLPVQRLHFGTGGSIATLIPLSQALTLGAGEYEVQFVWYAQSKSLLPDAIDDLKSNPVRIKVE